MPDLFADIAEYLRRARRPSAEVVALPTDVSALARPGLPAPPAPLASGHMLTCRFCGRRVRAGEGAAQFHDYELIEAVSCARCHRRRLDEEALGTARASARQGQYSASRVRPRCKYCGRMVGDAGDALRAARACPDCARLGADLDEAGGAGSD